MTLLVDGNTSRKCPECNGDMFNEWDFDTCLECDYTILIYE